MKLRHKIGLGILATLGLGFLSVFIGMTIHAVVNYNNWAGHDMSRLFKKWVTQGLLIKIETDGGAPKFTKYKLSNAEDFKA